MDLQELRSEIDKIDKELIRLFEQRMDISLKVATYKKQYNLPIHDPVREQEILDKISMQVKKEHTPAIKALYTLLFELSRAKQEEEK